MNRVKLLLKLARAFRRAQDGFDRNGDKHDDDNGQYMEKDGGGNSGENDSTSSVESEIVVKELPRVNGQRRFLVNGRKYTQIKLSWEAYAGVMSEIDTWMTKERRQKRRFFQHILNYTYDIIIVDDETNDIVIVGQKRIK